MVHWESALTQYPDFSSVQHLESCELKEEDEEVEIVVNDDLHLSNSFPEKNPGTVLRWIVTLAGHSGEGKCQSLISA